MKSWEDARIVARHARAARAAAQAAASGDRPIGWKVGFAAPAFQERLKITGPLVGFLTGERAHEAGRRGIVCRLVEAGDRAGGRCAYRPRCTAGADRETAAAAIAGISPAIEIVDFYEPPRIRSASSPTTSISVTSCSASGAGARRQCADGLTCRIIRRGAEFARTTDPQANTGEWIDIVQHVADMLAGSARAARRRNHHYRLGGAAADDGARRGWRGVRARPDRRRLGSLSLIRNASPMGMSKRLRLILAAMLVLAPASALAQTPSQAWPQKTVRFIVPLPPGSGMDLSARLVAERLSERWGQPVVVENRQGADGIPAVIGFLSARDNHTFLFSFAGIVTFNHLLHERLPYDPKELLPVAPVVDNFLGVSATAVLKVDTLADLVAAAKARPGKLNWAATPGLPYYVLLALQKYAGIEMV